MLYNRSKKKQPKSGCKLKGDRRKAISGGEVLLWLLKKLVKVKKNTPKLLDCCPGKAKTSQKLLIFLHFSVLSGESRLI